MGPPGAGLFSREVCLKLILNELPLQERYKFLTAVVIPRPIALVCTRDETGVHNAAPFSFFNVFSEDPAIIVLGFSSRGEDPAVDTHKDTLRNIRRDGEFVVNMVDRGITEAMNICASAFPYGVSELDAAGLTLAPSDLIGVDRIAESPASLECRLFQTIDLTYRRTLVLGEVLCLHIADEIFDPATRRVIPDKYDPLARLYGTNYARLGERFSMDIEPYETYLKPTD